jgi:translation initiation factor IF-3
LSYEPRIKINHQIRAAELRVVGDGGENYGVLSLQDALKKAESLGLDLIEISPNANPPVAKIMDYGKFQYAENKKQKAAKAKSHVTEVKSVQVKVGTGEHDLALKAKQASEWLKEGHLVRINLFLTGRSKFMEMKFFQERIDRVLRLITEQYKISDTAKKGPKGVSLMIEKA